MICTSMFTRTPYNNQKYDIDSNPFIYALKNIKGWKFDILYSDFHDIVVKFLNITNKLNKHYDTIVIVPSNYNINKRFADIISKHIKYHNIIEDYFRKKNKEDVYDTLNISQLEKNFLLQWKYIQ